MAISSAVSGILGNDVKDEKFYAAALRELESGKRRDGLWAIAVIRSEGDDTKVKGIYLSLRYTSRLNLSVRPLMTGLLESIIGKLGGSALSAGVGSLYKRLRPTKLSRPKAPRNFFEHFGPGISKDFVTSSIGAPHRRIESLWLYQFSDALAQFDFRGDGIAQSVALALTVNSPNSGFDLPGVGTPLGKLTLDEFRAEKDGKLIYRSSSRTWELLYKVKFPPHWASNYYTFGALSLLAPGVLRESTFSVNVAEQSPRVAANGVLVNWVGISDTSEELWFEWSIALPVAA